jgi:ABC-type sugar transport system permease subunit
VSIYPLVTLVRMAFSDVRIDNLFGDWPWVGTTNLHTLASSADFRDAVRNTFVFVAVVVALTVSGGFAAALTLLRNTRLNSWVQALMVLVWVLPPIVSGSLWRFIFSGDGVVNSLLDAAGVHRPVGFISDPTLALWSVALVTSWVSLPFAAIVFRAAILDVPPTLQEAAAIDGASRLQVLRYVIVPMVRPTLLTVTALVTVNAFRSFDFVYVMTAGGPGTASTTLPFLGYQQAFQQFAYGLGSGTAMTCMAVIIALAAGYVSLSRRESRAS